MKTIKNIILTLAAISMFSAYMFSQDKAGTTSMQFLKVMPCARATALGDAYSAVASGAEALYWNPAGLAWTEKQELSMTYISWIFDAKLYNMSYAISLGNFGSLGLMLEYVDLGQFDETKIDNFLWPGQSLPYLTGRTWKPYQYLVGLGFARKMTERFAFGVTVKYAYESLYDRDLIFSKRDAADSVTNTYTGSPNRGTVLFDVGFRYNTGFRTIQIGASAQNFGPDVKYNNTYTNRHYSAPMQFRVGISGDFVGKNALLKEDDNNRIGMMFDLFLANDASQQEHLGLEYEFSGTFALRAGYKFNYTTEGLTYGLGIHHALGKIKLSLDYSYGAMDAMISDYTSNVHRISLGVGIQ